MFFPLPARPVRKLGEPVSPTAVRWGLLANVSMPFLFQTTWRDLSGRQMSDALHLSLPLASRHHPSCSIFYPHLHLLLIPPLLQQPPPRFQTSMSPFFFCNRFCDLRSAAGSRDERQTVGSPLAAWSEYVTTIFGDGLSTRSIKPSLLYLVCAIKIASVRDFSFHHGPVRCMPSQTISSSRPVCLCVCGWVGALRGVT